MKICFQCGPTLPPGIVIFKRKFNPHNLNKVSNFFLVKRLSIRYFLHDGISWILYIHVVHYSLYTKWWHPFYIDKQTDRRQIKFLTENIPVGFLSTILGCTNLSINTLMCIAHVHNTQWWRTYELQYLELTFFQIIDISRAMIIFRYCCLGNSCNTENYITLRCVNHNIRLNSFSRICEWILRRWVLF